MNADAFAGLYQRYSNRLKHAMIARTGDPDQAEDATAAAFAAAWENIDRFRGESSFYTYLYRIGANNEIQKQRRRCHMVSLDAFETPLKELAVSDEVNGDAQHRANDALKLREALNTIPAIYRRVLIDHLVYELSVKRIARRNRIPVGTVLSRIFTAKKLLRQAWEG
jgi:RNA polymerase sigma-70 factor (ECF subfamily)